MTAAKGRLRFWAALALSVASLVLSACGPREPAQPRPLRIYNWTDYIDPARLPRCLTPLMYGRAEVIRMRVMGGGYRGRRTEAQSTGGRAHLPLLRETA